MKPRRYLSVHLHALSAAGGSCQNRDDDDGNSGDDDGGYYQRAAHENGRVQGGVDAARDAVPVLDEAFQQAGPFARQDSNREERIGAERESDRGDHEDDDLGSTSRRHQRHLATAPANNTIRTVA